jgi:hypothetical protein
MARRQVTFSFAATLPPVRLVDLEPVFLIIEEAGKLYRHADDPVGADGVMFLCPKCFITNHGSVGTHSVICWAPHVPQTEDPKPGRWALKGTGYSDLTLVAGSSSILITKGCMAHFFIQNGEIVMS